MAITDRSIQGIIDQRDLASLVDVDTSGMSDGDSLVYNSSSGKWKPVEVTGGSGSGSAGTGSVVLIRGQVNSTGGNTMGYVVSGYVVGKFKAGQGVTSEVHGPAQIDMSFDRIRREDNASFTVVSTVALLNNGGLTNMGVTELSGTSLSIENMVGADGVHQIVMLP